MRRELLLKLEKWAMWIALIAVIILVRHLFPVIFLTFVLTYIGNTLVGTMGKRWPRRRLNIVVVFTLFLLILTGVGLLVVPKMFGEARQLALFYLSRDSPKTPAVTAPGDAMRSTPPVTATAPPPTTTAAPARVARG